MPWVTINGNHVLIGEEENKSFAQVASGLPMSKERREQIINDYKQRVSSIANDAPKTLPPENLQKRIDDAYKSGLEAKGEGIKSGRQAVRNDKYWSRIERYEKPEFVAFEAGIKGNDKPYWVNGWRYGEIPKSGYSTNYAESKLELGVSFMGTDNGMSTSDMGFEMFTSGRTIIYGSGFLNTNDTGSDGEPLLLWARKTGVK